MSRLYMNDLPDDFICDGDIAVDTEAMGLNVHRDRLCLIQMCDSSGQVTLVKFDADVRNIYGRADIECPAPNLRRLFEDENVMKIFHFARFDVGIIHAYLGIRTHNLFCTKIASKLVRTYTDCHGLKDLCRELLNVQISKAKQSSDWGSDSFDREQIDYASSDVLHLHKLRAILEKMLHRERRYDIAQRLFSFVPTIAEIDIMGWAEGDIFAHK